MATVMIGLMLIPATVGVTSNGVTVKPSSALAALQDPTGGGGGTAPTHGPGCVTLSIKIFSKDNNEVCPGPDGGGVIIAYLKVILQFLSGGVGIVILLMLTIAGVQYMTAVGQPEQVKAAKSRIQNAITGLVLFLIAFAVLNLIIPGSIFG